MSCVRHKNPATLVCIQKNDMNYVENGARTEVLTPLCLQSDRNQSNDSCFFRVYIYCERSGTPIKFINEKLYLFFRKVLLSIFQEG